MTIELTTLPSGLRVISDRVADMESVSVGVWADIGTRHEDPAHNGVAHMVEHMLFNGTPTRTSRQIAETIENVGGQMNAYTSRETTAYYIHALKDDLHTGLEILADMVQHPLFPDQELEKERQVIIQEIGMNNDTPDELVFDHYQQTAYPQQTLGAPILGTAEIVAGMSKDTLFDYVRRFYTPKNLVVSAAGNLSHDALAAQAEKLFSELPEDSAVSYAPARYHGGQKREEKDLEQSHLVLGFQGVKRDDPDYYTAVLLATILGGGMSSRLFQEIREKRGLVYAVHAAHDAYHDDGLFEIYAGTAPERLDELTPALCAEISKIAQSAPEAGELSRAKAQIKAGLLMSRESMLSRANRQAKYLLNFGRKPDIQELIGQIDSVTREDVRALAARIFAGAPTMAALGPLGRLEDFETLSSRLRAAAA